MLAFLSMLYDGSDPSFNQWLMERDIGCICFFYLMLKKTFFEFNIK